MTIGAQIVIEHGIRDGDLRRGLLIGQHHYPELQFRDQRRAREEPAQRASTLLSSREENGEDRRWPAAIHLDRFRLAEASASDDKPGGVP